MNPPSGRIVSLPYNSNVLSSGIKKGDGNFDGQGRSIPGELLPRQIVSDGVRFRLGKAGADNAVICRGQTVAVPSGRHRTLYVLGSAAGGDTEAMFGVGSAKVPVKVQAWDGFVGQWDNRLWGGEVPELTYDWHNPLVGLQPGYIKRDPVAWYADHRRLADGSDDIYKFCYLFRYAIPVADGVSEVTLPMNDKVRILAATVAENLNDSTTASAPLYDVLERSGTAGPTVSPGGGSFHDSMEVTVGHSFYWSPTDTLHYTLDGSQPGPASPVCSGTIPLRTSATVKVVEVDANGHAGPVASAHYDVDDTTPPTVVSSAGLGNDRYLSVSLSESVDRGDAENPANYHLTPEIPISGATLADDGRTVNLTLQGPLQTGVSYAIDADHIRDLSPHANPSQSRGSVTVLAPVVTESSPRLGLTKIDAGLPTDAQSPWTINCFVRMDARPADLSVIAGFGDGTDNNGAERFLIARSGHIYFWGSGIDIDTGTPYDLHTWQMVTATFDGTTVRVYKDGKELAHDSASFADAAKDLLVAPPSPWEYGHKFTGEVRDLTVWDKALSPFYVQELLIAHKD